jgi:hypothetical protein
MCRKKRTSDHNSLVLKQHVHSDECTQTSVYVFFFRRLILYSDSISDQITTGESFVPTLTSPLQEH